CYTCHQLGEASTRTVPTELGHFANTFEAWEARIQTGQASENMVNNIGRIDAQRALKLFADWTDRINAGALPAEKPPPPQVVERQEQYPAAVALLGRGADLGQPGQRAQPDVRPGGPGLVYRPHPRPRQPGLLQGRIGASLGEAVPGRPLDPPAGDVRPENAKI